MCGFIMLTTLRIFAPDWEITGLSGTFEDARND